ncbi:aminoglycoside phosphotransferase family protein [Kribbella sp. CA-245084]|uniref:aminoglycoside phosphotransferase family protein n=1 Tax=Kribbella sp. CA-245084 TaxID=3239940 RepID=UPI003D8A4BA6
MPDHRAVRTHVLVPSPSAPAAARRSPGPVLPCPRSTGSLIRWRPCILVCNVPRAERAKGVEVNDGRLGGVGGIVPASLAERIRSYHSAGPAWLQDLPELIAECVTRWELTLLPAFEPGGDSSWTAPVRLGDGGLAVLQITVPLPIHHDHVTALQVWAGRGAVRLFAHEPAIRATLMECCVPGLDAADLPPDEADGVAVEVLSQLWAVTLPVAGLQPLAEAAVQRVRVMEARADQFGDVVDPGPFREAAELFTSLPGSTAPGVLLHGDFHRRNVLLSGRGWLAIDPSSMAGDPSFDVAMFLLHDMHDSATTARVDALADRLGLERERTRAWLFALTIQMASWHLSIGDRPTHDAYIRAGSTLL